MFLTLTLIIAVVIFIVNMFSGGGSPRTLREIFYGVYYAEDAVMSDEDEPNSVRSVEKCIRAGVGIKTEAYISKDSKIMISASAKAGPDELVIGETDSRVLSELGLMNITEFIEKVDGRVPVIIELKTGANNEVMCRRTADAILASGHKNIAVASFRPGIISWFKGKAKPIFRGLIAAPSKDFVSLSAYDRFMTANLANNSVARPQFVLYRNKKETFLAKFAMSLGLIKGVWTIKSEAEGKEYEQTKDMIVFRGFTPRQGQFKILPAREQTKMEIEAEKKERARLERRRLRRQYKAERQAEKERKKNK